MQYFRTPEFKECAKLLDDEQREEVKRAFQDLKRAFEGDRNLRSEYKLHPLKKYPGIYGGHLKYDLVFTFHYETDSSGEKVVFFRKIGTHGIYKNP